MHQRQGVECVPTDLPTLAGMPGTISVLAWLTRPIDKDQQSSSSFFIDAATTHRQYCPSHPDAPIEASVHPVRGDALRSRRVSKAQKMNMRSGKTLAAVVDSNGLPMLHAACSDAIRSAQSIDEVPCCGSYDTDVQTQWLEVNGRHKTCRVDGSITSQGGQDQSAPGTWKREQ